MQSNFHCVDIELFYIDFMISNSWWMICTHQKEMWSMIIDQTMSSKIYKCDLMYHNVTFEKESVFYTNKRCRF